MQSLSMRIESRGHRALTTTAAAALSACLLLTALGCERKGEAVPPTGTQVADRGAAGTMSADAAGAQTPASVSAATSPLNIVFDPPVLDFGYIPPNVNKKGTITVYNHGRLPVRIKDVKSSCKCTTLNDLKGVVIKPQGSATVEAELRGRSESGGRKASIRFIFDGYEDQNLTVDLRGEVTLPIRTSPSILNLARGEATGHVVVESVGGETFNILAANGQPPRYVGFNPDIDEPKNSYVLEYDLTDEVATGTLPHWWVVETDHPDCPLVDAWVRHPMTIETPNRSRKWRVAERRTILGVLKPGEPAQFTVLIKDISPNKIASVRSLSDQFEARLVAFKPDGPDAEATVEVTPAADVRGMFQGTIEFAGPLYTHVSDVVGKVAG